ncbi:MAG: hypothetical protein ACYCQI_08415 [Gammaproteobacteria bacterium]
MFFRQNQQQKYTAITSAETVKALFPNEEKSMNSFHIETEIVVAALPNTSEFLKNLKEIHYISDIDWLKDIYRILRWLTCGNFETMTEYNAKLQFLEFISYIETACKKLPDLIGIKDWDLEKFKSIVYSRSDSAQTKLCSDLRGSVLFIRDIRRYVDENNYSALISHIENSCKEFKTYPRLVVLKDFYQAALIKRLGLHDKTLRPERMPEEEFKLCMALAKDAEVNLSVELEKTLSADADHRKTFSV